MLATRLDSRALAMYFITQSTLYITEAAMDADAARDDIAFIRRSIEQGRRIAGAWSPDMLVWALPSRLAISAPTPGCAGTGRSIHVGCGSPASCCPGPIRCAAWRVACPRDRRMRPPNAGSLR